MTLSLALALCLAYVEQHSGAYRAVDVCHVTNGGEAGVVASSMLTSVHLSGLLSLPITSSGPCRAAGVRLAPRREQ